MVIAALHHYDSNNTQYYKTKSCLFDDSELIIDASLLNNFSDERGTCEG